MDKATQQNAAMVEETSAAARQLSSDITALADRASEFQAERRFHDVPVAVDRRAENLGASAAKRMQHAVRAA
jgi:methyl-accepting chemotaxis protein